MYLEAIYGYYDDNNKVVKRVTEWLNKQSHKAQKRNG